MRENTGSENWGEVGMDEDSRDPRDSHGKSGELDFSEQEVVGERADVNILPASMINPIAEEEAEQQDSEPRPIDFD